jgi:hypothetical protein
MRKFAYMAMVAILPFALDAARLTLRDGTVIYGQFLSGNAQSIVFQDQTGMRRQFDLHQIQTLDFTPVSAPLDNSPPPYGNNAYRSEERYDHDWTVLPAGTEISVRTDETINSANAAPGQTCRASIARDIADPTGNVVIPRGSEAALVVRQVNEGGTLNNGSFVLDLDSLRVNGRRYTINTSDIEARDRSGLGKNKRTGEMVGGGAVLGTLLGVIAGGGKGAAIGALAGAAAGGSAEVLTKGREVRVPAETMLNFRLEQPLHLREAM